MVIRLSFSTTVLDRENSSEEKMATRVHKRYENQKKFKRRNRGLWSSALTE